jgi:hypothetical protein
MNPNNTLIFIGDIVGEPGLAFLEARLPKLILEHQADFVVANAENLTLCDDGAGMTRKTLERLFATGVQLVTGGNHSWDGPEGVTVHDDPRVLRPINADPSRPGRGAGVITAANGTRLGVVNVAGRSAIPDVRDPLESLETQLQHWDVDAVLVDFHGESVFEKTVVAYALAGRIAALLGTHTHVQTRDERVVEDGVALVSDVGMTGPSGGAQGYDPAGFVARLRSHGAARPPLELARGRVELGAVVVKLEGARAVAVQRLTL